MVYEEENERLGKKKKKTKQAKEEICKAFGIS